jgi:hypothetical protein
MIIVKTRHLMMSGFYLHLFALIRVWYHTLRINPSNNAITASTIRICISPDALYTKNPSIHPITSITAIRYNMLLMIKKF